MSYTLLRGMGVKAMNTKERNLLEKAYEAEINSAMNKNIPHLMQTKSKTAKKLVDDLLLAEKTIVFKGVTVKGYELTHAGRLLYCIRC
jgi:hypothetical protein